MGSKKKASGSTKEYATSQPNNGTAHPTPPPELPDLGQIVVEIQELAAALKEFEALADGVDGVAGQGQGEQQEETVPEPKVPIQFKKSAPGAPVVPEKITRAAARELLQDLNFDKGENIEWYVDVVSNGHIDEKDLAELMELSMQAFEQDWKVIYERAKYMQYKTFGLRTGSRGLYYCLRECLSGDGLAAFHAETDLYEAREEYENYIPPPENAQEELEEDDGDEEEEDDEGSSRLW